MINLIGMFIVGVITGALARWFYPGPVEIGFWMTGLLGIGGAFLGGYLTRLVKKPDDPAKLNRAGLIMSIIGSILILLIGRKLFNLW
jgi:uncharacterized membrane protein YeaQ/YmgE (transglycosylase-associated protein family)